MVMQPLVIIIIIWIITISMIPYISILDVIHWLKQTPFYQTQLHLYSIGAVLTLNLWVGTVALAAPRDLATTCLGSLRSRIPLLLISRVFRDVYGREDITTALIYPKIRPLTIGRPPPSQTVYSPRKNSVYVVCVSFYFAI